MHDFVEHPTEDVMERFLLHQSGDEELEAIETHILACESCVSRLEALQEFIDTAKVAMREMHLEATEKAVQKQKRQSWFSVKSLSLAGAAAAIALAIAVVPRLMPNHPAANVDLSAYRGLERTVVPKGWPLHIRMNANDLAEGPVEIEVVDREGTELWKGNTAILHESAEVNIPKIKVPGPYFVRVYRAVDGNPEGDLLREFAVQVR